MFLYSVGSLLNKLVLEGIKWNRKNQTRKKDKLKRVSYNAMKIAIGQISQAIIYANPGGFYVQAW